MYLKVHHTPMGKIVALCDAELLGRVLAEGKYQIDLQRHAEFYKGKLVKKEEAVRELGEAENANIIGRKSLSAAKAARLDVSRAISISGVPHLQAYRII